MVIIMQNKFSKLIYFIGNEKPGFLVIILLSLLVSAFDTVSIGLVGPFMTIAGDKSLSNLSGAQLWFYKKLNFTTHAHFTLFIGAALVLIFLMKSLLTFYAKKHIFKFTISHQGNVRSRLLSSYLSAPYTFHLSRNSAFTIHNVLTEVSAYKFKFLFPALNFVSDVILIMCLLALLLMTDMLATLAVILLFAIPAFVFVLFKEKISMWGKEDSQAQANMIKLVNHSLGGIKEVKVIGCEEYFKNLMSKEINRYVKASSSFQSFQILPRVTTELLIVCFLISLTCIFLFLTDGSQKNYIGILTVFALSAIKLIPASNRCISGISSIQNSSYTIDKLYEDLYALEVKQGCLFGNSNIRKPNKEDILHKGYLQRNGLEKELIGFNRVIEIKNLVFNYQDTQKPAIDNISITLEKGKSIAFIGKSGAGKTTLVDIILGLLIPTSGDITVDGKSIYSDMRNWQSLIGYIPQSIFLLDDTIEKNIAFGVPDNSVDRVKVNEAIRISQLDVFVDSLPDKQKTYVGERGVRVSGGQRQRIGIARALYHQKDILVLDEATASLDSETEKMVTQSITSLYGVKTMITIAHRLSTIQSCDYVYQIDEGKIVWSGTPEDRPKT